MENEFSIAEQATFIVGHPRSGTSLLRGLLDGHPQLCVFPNEMKFFRNARRWLDADAFLDRSDLRLSFQSAYAIEGISQSAVHTDLSRRLAAATDLRDAMLAVMAAYAAIDPTSDGATKVRWVEKTPHNFTVAPLLHDWFEGTRTIWLIRDPRDVLRSVRKKHPSWPLGRFCRRYIAYAACLRAAERNAAGHTHRLSYEQLVQSPEATMDRVADFLDIRRDPALRTPSVCGKVDTRSTWVMPRIESSKNRCQEDTVSNAEIAELERKLGPVMAELGYWTARSKPSAGMPVWSMLCDRLAAATWQHPPSSLIIAGSSTADRIRAVARIAGISKGLPVRRNAADG
jgi:hypothetical protein